VFVFGGVIIMDVEGEEVAEEGGERGERGERGVGGVKSESKGTGERWEEWWKEEISDRETLGSGKPKVMGGS